MPSRREFIATVAGAAALWGCSRAHGQPSAKGPPGKKAAPSEPDAPASPPSAPAGEDPPAGAAPAEGAAPVKTPGLREDTPPTLNVPQDKTLARLRRTGSPHADLFEVSGKGPTEMLAAGLAAFGGIGRVVKRGDLVVVCPNFGLARPQSSAAVTNAELVGAMIKTCFGAGARDVAVINNTCAATPAAFRLNGAFSAVAGTGARLMNPWSPDQYVIIGDFEKGAIHKKKLGWQAVPEMLLRADVLIDMPVFKHHEDTGGGGAVKNLMGLVWRREAYHNTDLPGCIAELAATLRPTLVVTDATRVLTTGGPLGPGKIEPVGRLLIAADPVLADAHACQWIKRKPKEIEHLVRAAALKVGKLDPGKARIKRVKA